MKKVVFIIILLSLCFGFALNVSAIEDLEAELSERLFSAMDDDVGDLLQDFGITSLDSESIYNASFKSIFNYYKDSIKNYFKGNLELFAKVLSLIIIGAAASVIISEKRFTDMLSVLLIPIVTILLIDEINLTISSALSLMKLNGNLMTAFVPVYAVAITVAGNPATALTYNTLVLGFAEIVSAVINYGLVDIIGCFFCVCIGFSVNKSINFSRFLNAVNRLITFIVGLGSSLFTSVLSVKGIFSVSTDSVMSKGIRFAIGSLIPVIGSSISDAYSSLLGSLGILKNSVAVIGIFALLIINFPVIIE
ncbi:MAG: hypothetical protein IJN88_07765, partial [Clostridia bacterium]|nr:hypothetical protein [Clostridia bacterium]